MKKILVVLLLVFSTNTKADDDWIAPLVGGLVGGIVIGEVIVTPRYGYNHQYSPLYFPMQPDYYTPQPVYVAPPQPVYVVPPEQVYAPPQQIYYNGAPVYRQPAQEYYRDLELRRRYGEY